MKWIALIVAALLASHSVAAAEGNPSGRGSVTGDPRCQYGESACRETIGASTSNPSGSGASTSGGKDDNGDQGRDKMPESNMSVRSQDQQSAKPQ
jgi:hypothetical protein